MSKTSLEAFLPSSFMRWPSLVCKHIPTNQKLFWQLGLHLKSFQIWSSDPVDRGKTKVNNNTNKKQKGTWILRKMKKRIMQNERLHPRTRIQTCLILIRTDSAWASTVPPGLDICEDTPNVHLKNKTLRGFGTRKFRSELKTHFKNKRAF